MSLHFGLLAISAADSLMQAHQTQVQYLVISTFGLMVASDDA
jgi:hypothetical protein